MIKTLIKSNPVNKRPFPDYDDYLEVSEFFFDTIQGEGINIGHPAAFLRMRHCTMNCIWCDTASVWRKGDPYTFRELLDMIANSGLDKKLKAGQHLVLTGGSPLKQQDALARFLRAFYIEFGFMPFIEIENECTIMPSADMILFVNCWNNSPKLANSGNLEVIRYQPNILKTLSNLGDSWFKFVIREEKDWQEIEDNYLQHIPKEQIILMPVGGSREELHKNRGEVIRIAVRENVRYSSREHVELWDKMTGV